MTFDIFNTTRFIFIVHVEIENDYFFYIYHKKHNVSEKEKVSYDQAYVQ